MTTFDRTKPHINIWNIRNVDSCVFTNSAAILAASSNAMMMDIYSSRAKELQVKFSDIVAEQISITHKQHDSFIWPIRSYDMFIPDELVNSMREEIKNREILWLQSIFMELWGIENFPVSELPDHLYGYLLESVSPDKNGILRPTKKCEEEYHRDFQAAINYIEKQKDPRFKNV